MTTAVSAECGTCGATNRSQAKFCGSCGALLKTEVICPGCGVGNPTSQRFCNDCGIELRARTGPARSGAPIPATLAQGRYQLDRLLGEELRP
ncbi:zinc ribbon domain-containing protein [Mycobacterium riyadhense]|uniref:zinc ribbon domain-containing protein n=1 Tax=Mycobacterium riyadhense TaxID=486698 RepID=UPI00195C8C55